MTVKSIQQNLGLWVTCSASVLQDEKTFLINFNLINEWCLKIWVVHDTNYHMIISEPTVLSLSLSCYKEGGEKGGGILHFKWDYEDL